MFPPSIYILTMDFCWWKMELIKANKWMLFWDFAENILSQSAYVHTTLIFINSHNTWTQNVQCAVFTVHLFFCHHLPMLDARFGWLIQNKKSSHKWWSTFGGCFQRIDCLHVVEWNLFFYQCGRVRCTMPLIWKTENWKQ